jgi:hypothetical protein
MCQLVRNIGKQHGDIVSLSFLFKGKYAKGTQDPLVNVLSWRVITWGPIYVRQVFIDRQYFLKALFTLH